VRFLASSGNLRKGVVAGDIQLPAAVPPHPRECFRFIFLQFMPIVHNFDIFMRKSENAKLYITAFRSHKYSSSLKKHPRLYHHLYALNMEIYRIGDQVECRH
jgi:hypothetical protein